MLEVKNHYDHQMPGSRPSVTPLDDSSLAFSLFPTSQCLGLRVVDLQGKWAVLEFPDQVNERVVDPLVNFVSV